MVIDIPETRSEAEKRAKEIGFPVDNVYCLEKDDRCYIVPRGIETSAGKRAYAEARDAGKSKEYAAKVAHTVDKKAR